MKIYISYVYNVLYALFTQTRNNYEVAWSDRILPTRADAFMPYSLEPTSCYCRLSLDVLTDITESLLKHFDDYATKREFGCVETFLMQQKDGLKNYEIHQDYLDHNGKYRCASWAEALSRTPGGKKRDQLCIDVIGRLLQHGHEGFSEDDIKMMQQVETLLQMSGSLHHLFVRLSQDDVDNEVREVLIQSMRGYEQQLFAGIQRIQSHAGFATCLLDRLPLDKEFGVVLHT